MHGKIEFFLREAMDFSKDGTVIFWPTFRKKNGELKDGECMERLNFFLRERWIFLRMANAWKD